MISNLIYARKEPKSVILCLSKPGVGGRAGVFCIFFSIQFLGGAASQLLFPYLEMESYLKLIRNQTCNWLLKLLNQKTSSFSPSSFWLVIGLFLGFSGYDSPEVSETHPRVLHPEGKRPSTLCVLGALLAAEATWVFKKWADKNKQKPNPYQKRRNKLASSLFCAMLLSAFCIVISVWCRLSMSLFVFFLCNQWNKYRIYKHHWLTCLFAYICNIAAALKFCFLLH